MVSTVDIMGHYLYIQNDQLVETNMIRQFTHYTRKSLKLVTKATLISIYNF